MKHGIGGPTSEANSGFLLLPGSLFCVCAGMVRIRFMDRHKVGVKLGKISFGHIQLHIQLKKKQPKALTTLFLTLTLTISHTLT